MGPDRAQEMARAMQMHLDERKAQAGTLGNQAGALMEAGAMGLGEAYNGLSMPQRPIDAVMAGRGPVEGTDGAALLQAMAMNNSPELGMQAVPTMGMSPQELGIGPSPEWMAASDAQLSDMDFKHNHRAFQRAMRKAAMKAKRQEYSDEYAAPQAESERNRLAAEHWAKRNGS